VYNVKQATSPQVFKVTRFPKVKWLQYTGKVGKCTGYWCQFFFGFNTPKIIKLVNFWHRVIWKI